MVTPKTMGARLRAFRKARGLSRPQAAEQLPISERTIARHEAGESPITLPDAIEYAKLYRFNVVDLIRPVDLLPGVTRDEPRYFVDQPQVDRLLAFRRAKDVLRLADPDLGAYYEILPAYRELSRTEFEDIKDRLDKHLQDIGVRLHRAGS